LWDIYIAIKNNHQGDKELANRLSTQLVLESVKHLPQADLVSNHSPVTFIQFAKIMNEYSGLIEGLTPSDRDSVLEVLKARGLLNGASIDSPDWLDIGPGTNLFISNSVTPGVYVADDPQMLKVWLNKSGGEPGIVTQGPSSVNGQLDPGEVDAIWLDLQNNSSSTAGGVLVTVTSLSPDLIILDKKTNIGYLSGSNLNQTQVMYQKINGKTIVNDLNLNQSANSVPIGNSYFQTNPLFNHTWRTAVWVKVSTSATHGEVIHLQVDALPANGVSSTKIFPITIH
jgi:hypothetical protein